MFLGILFNIVFKIINTMKSVQLITILILQATQFFSQTSIIKGKVTDKINNEPIPFANIYLEQTQTGVATDFDGLYELKNINPGQYNLTISFVGYQTRTISEIIVNPNKPTIIYIQLNASSTSLEEIEIKSSPFQKTKENMFYQLIM